MEALYVYLNDKSKHDKFAFLILYSKSWFQIATTNQLMTTHAEIEAFLQIQSPFKS